MIEAYFISCVVVFIFLGKKYGLDWFDSLVISLIWPAVVVTGLLYWLQEK